ncbi:MAG: TonB-dependent receptor [Tunicatimonas sp.]
MQQNRWCLLYLLTFAVCLLGIPKVVTAQETNITQTIRGTIQDKATHQPLVGATVYLRGTDPIVGSVTNQSGHFSVENVPVGRYQLVASSVGFETFTDPVLLGSGKETVLSILLEQTAKNLDEVVITDRPSSVQTAVPISSRAFTVEETRRYAATFFDPARLVTSFPGVVGVNDQANHISVRGNSPNSLLWRLEGVDIVNPNHLSNAGTFGDRRVQSGGSQSILSTQVLDDSRFYSGTFPATFGNAVGGVLDMRLRKGNNQQREYTAQAGLIGLEFAAEGPFRDDYDGSYLVNYRYSTVGILTNGLGLDFGGERISFQDLSFNLSFPMDKAGEFTVFGVGGTGSNVFQAVRDSAAWEAQEDRFDVTFTNDMAAVGMTHTLPLGKKSLLKSVIAASSLASNQRSDRVSDTYENVRVLDDRYQETRISVTSSITRKVRGNSTIQGGFYFDNLYYQLNSSEGGSDAGSQSLVQGQGSSQLVRPYVDAKLALSPQWVANVGLHLAYFTLNGSHSVEPRLSLRWNNRVEASRPQYITLAYGRHSQLQLPGVYFSTGTSLDGSNLAANRNLGFTKSDQYTVAYDYQWTGSLRVHTEAYYQRLFNVPVSVLGNSFSALNLLEGFVREPLVNQGTGRNYGWEASVEKKLSDSYYFLLSGSLYESKYTGANGIERDTRFNGNYALSATGGKEFIWSKRGKRRVFSINLRSAYVGGLRVTPIDEVASVATQGTVFLEDRAFSEKLPDYFKVDARLSLRKDTPRYSSVWSLDLQNATNRRNVAYQYYDTIQGQVLTQYQLGLIPILTYRIEF